MTYQTQKDDCGKACVRNALTLIYKDESYQWLYLKDNDGDFLSMQTDLRKEGAEYKGYLCPFSDLLKLERDRFPLIVQILNGDVTHFVVVKKIKKKSVVILDPEFGKYELSYAEFEKIYLGKALVLEKKASNVKKPKTDILSLRERLFYVFLFMMECLSFTFLFHSISVNDMISMILFLVLSAVILMLHLFYNSYLMSLLNQKVLFPYLDCYRNSKDFRTLSTYQKETITRYSNLITTAFCVFEMFVLLFTNGVFPTILGVLSVGYGICIYLTKEKYHGVNRYCSLEEKKMIVSLKVGDSEEVCLKNDYRNHYEKSRKKASEFHTEIVLSYLFLLFLLCVFILIDMRIKDIFSLNFFLFYLSIGTSLSFLSEKILRTYFYDEKRIHCLNTLSQDLSFFLLKNKASLRYTNKVRFGGFRHGKQKEAHTRLSR